jgi:DNA repair protein RecO (recombination protein O)
LSGYALELEATADVGVPLAPDARYRYLFDRGPVEFDGQLGGSVVRGATLLALAGRLPLDETVLPEAKQFMRAVLTHYLGDRPLHARSLFVSPDAD